MKAEELIPHVEEIRTYWLQGDFEEALTTLESSPLPSPVLQFERLFMLLFQGRLDEYNSVEESIDDDHLSELDTFVFDTLTLHKCMMLGQYGSNYGYLKDKIYDELQELMKSASLPDYYRFWAGIYWLLGGVHIYSINQMVSQTKTYWDKVLPIAEGYPWYSGNYLYIASHNNFAEMLRLTGNLDAALEEIILAKKRVEEVSMNLVLPEIYSQLGSIYYELNRYEEAVRHYREGLQIPYFNDIPSYQAIYLYRLFKLYRKISDQGGMDDIHQRMKALADRSDSRVVLQASNLVEVERLLLRNRRKSVTRAQRILEEMAVDEDLLFEYIPIVKLSLLNLLVNELSNHDNEDILSEITTMVDELVELSINWNSIRLQVELMIIRSKVELSKQNMEEAHTQLQQAKRRAQSIQNKRLEAEIDHQLERFDDTVKTWSKLIQENPTVQKMLSELELDEYIGEVLDRLGSS